MNAPAGTSISFTMVTGPGSFAAAPVHHRRRHRQLHGHAHLVTTGAPRRHRAHDVTVGGVALTRTTNGTGANSRPATRPGSTRGSRSRRRDERGRPAAHLHGHAAEGHRRRRFVPAAGEHVDVTLTDSNGARTRAPTGTCTTAGANTDANGQCTITFTSPTAGQVTGHATATLHVGGRPDHRRDRRPERQHGDAVKTFVDANIQITPNGVNRVGDPHMFTGHVNVNDGTGAGFVNAPPAPSITFTNDSGPGSLSAPVLHDGRRDRQLHRQAHLDDDRRSTSSARTRRSRSAASRSRATTDGTGGNSGPRRRRGSTRRSRSRRTRPTRRSAAHVHGHAVEGHGRRAASSRPRASTST